MPLLSSLTETAPCNIKEITFKLDICVLPASFCRFYFLSGNLSVSASSRPFRIGKSETSANPAGALRESVGDGTSAAGFGNPAGALMGTPVSDLQTVFGNGMSPTKGQ